MQWLLHSGEKEGTAHNSTCYVNLLAVIELCFWSVFFCWWSLSGRGRLMLHLESLASGIRRLFRWTSVFNSISQACFPSSKTHNTQLCMISNVTLILELFFIQQYPNTTCWMPICLPIFWRSNFRSYKVSIILTRNKSAFNYWGNFLEKPLDVPNSTTLASIGSPPLSNSWVSTRFFSSLTGWVLDLQLYTNIVGERRRVMTV